MVERYYRHNRNLPLNGFDVPIGTNKFTGAPVYFRERMAFGVVIVAAITRYGKSIVVRNLLTDIGQKRPIIILDYLGEHTNAKYPNFLSSDRNAKCLPKMVEIKNFKFKISQFFNEGDWLALSFADRGAQLMADLARQVDAHNDDPELFRDMLDDVPDSANHAGVASFERTYGFKLPNINTSTLNSCKTVYTYLLRTKFFAEADDPVYDFGKIALQYKYLNINFSLDKTDIHKARAVAGKVLEQLKAVMGQFPTPPVIIVEEADVLAPDDPGSSYPITSVAVLVEFVLKLQKKGMEIFFIVQDTKRLNSAITGNFHSMILGQLPTGNPDAELCKHLVWDIDRNYREFILKVKGRPGYEVFIPYDSMTAY